MLCYFIGGPDDGKIQEIPSHNAGRFIGQYWRVASRQVYAHESLRKGHKWLITLLEGYHPNLDEAECRLITRRKGEARKGDIRAIRLEEWQ